MKLFRGPDGGVGAECTALAPGVWITSGRAVVLEGEDHLALVDPGDEACGPVGSPSGPLADLLRLEGETGKRLASILVTHAHPDHVGNLDVFRRLGDVRVVAHASTPTAADVRVGERRLLSIGRGVEAIPTPGHSSLGDDLSFWVADCGLLLSGDLVQPKGESWEETFYPSPFVHFRDGELYLSSLRLLSELPVGTLVTGHREIRRSAAARKWIELSIRSIRRVEELVARRPPKEGLEEGARTVYRQLAGERGIPEETIQTRFSGRPSPFENFDLPGIAYYWNRARP